MVLHVIDGGFQEVRSGFTSELELRARGCSLLLRRLRRQQRVVMAGPAPAARLASEAGLRIDARISPPLGSTTGGWLSLRRLVEAEGRPGAVMCWGRDASRLAHRALGETVPRVVVVPEGEAAPECAHTLVYSESARRRLIDAGATEESVTAVPPPIEACAVNAELRSRSRALLGCNGDSVIVLAVGSARQLNAARFSFAMGLLEVAGVHITGVIGRGAAERRRAERLCAAEPKLRVIESDRPMSELMAGADLAILEAGGSGPTSSAAPAPWIAAAPILAAHAAGVPVVAPEWADADGVYPREAARHLLAFNSSLPELARRAALLIEDQQTRRACAAAVLRDVRERALAEGFVAKVGEVLDSVVDESAAAEAAM